MCEQKDLQYWEINPHPFVFSWSVYTTVVAYSAMVAFRLQYSLCSNFTRGGTV